MTGKDLFRIKPHGGENNNPDWDQDNDFQNEPAEIRLEEKWTGIKMRTVIISKAERKNNRKNIAQNQKKSRKKG